MYSNIYEDCVVNPRQCGLSAQATDCYREAVPPEYRRESRLKPATLDVDIANTEERQFRLVGSFPKARLVLGEVAENLCVQRGYLARISGADVQRGLVRRIACRRFVGRRMDDSIVRLWVLSSGKGPYVNKP